MPRNPDRIDAFLGELKKCWKMVPDWRFMQLIENVFGRFDNNLLFYVEDDQSQQRLREFFRLTNDNQ